MSTAAVALLAVAPVGLALVVGAVAGVAWACSPRRPAPRPPAGPLLDRTEPLA